MRCRQSLVGDCLRFRFLRVRWLLLLLSLSSASSSMLASWWEVSENEVPVRASWKSSSSSSSSFSSSSSSSLSSLSSSLLCRCDLTSASSD